MIISLLDSLFSFSIGNWGNLASVFGAILTVVFSIKANNSATAAKRASTETRDKLQSLDLLVELNRLLGRTDDLLFRIDSGVWPLVEERSNDLRVSIAACISIGRDIFSEETSKKLGEAVAQFKTISGGADRALQPDKNSPDPSRYKRIILDQKETLTLALQELKTRLGDANV